MTRTRPADAYDTVGTGAGGASCAAAMSAAIFGSAVAASFDQPPLSRMLTKRIGRSAGDGAPSVALASSRKRRLLLRAGDEQIVARLRGALEGAGLAPAKQRVDGCAPFPSVPRARASAGPSIGIVSLQLQIRVVIGGRSRERNSAARGDVDSATAAGRHHRGKPAPAARAAALPARPASTSSSNSPRTADWFIGAASTGESDRACRSRQCRCRGRPSR
jgi:hypothetical protein